jgi:hypothetical protein
MHILIKAGFKIAFPSKHDQYIGRDLLVIFIGIILIGNFLVLKSVGRQQAVLLLPFFFSDKKRQ